MPYTAEGPSNAFIVDIIVDSSSQSSPLSRLPSTGSVGHCVGDWSARWLAASHVAAGKWGWPECAQGKTVMVLGPPLSCTVRDDMKKRVFVKGMRRGRMYTRKEDGVRTGAVVCPTSLEMRRKRKKKDL